MALIGDPELLFLDEPTTGFDPEARRKFWDLITALRADGTTILLTTHYLEEAEQLADRVAVISAGRLVEMARPAELGGRRDLAATVVWTDADGRHEIHTETPTRMVTELAARFGAGEVPSLQVLRPTLEDVYLSLIGEPPTTNDTDGALR
ncbi:MAG: AAA family ATPase, partial [Actinomycetes bacterium]